LHLKKGDEMTHAEIAKALAERPHAAVATVVRTGGSAPRTPGARMLVFPDGSTQGTVGGGTLEKKVVEDALALFATGGTRIETYGLRPKEQGGIGMVCGGESEVFIEILGAGDRLLVVGGGHIGLALHRLGSELGWETDVVDDREEFARPERFPGARTRHISYDDKGLAQGVTSRTAIVIVTHAHEGDRAALGSVIHSPAFYIGMIGSSRKVRTIFSALTEDGVPASRLEAVHAPIGLHIGAESPAEIALSIFAEILARKNEIRPPIRTVKEEKERDRNPS
jgi:xanthine dehydrogenase accessory factor